MNKFEIPMLSLAVILSMFDMLIGHFLNDISLVVISGFIGIIMVILLMTLLIIKEIGDN